MHSLGISVYPDKSDIKEVYDYMETERIDSQSFQGRLRILLRGNCGRHSC